TERQRVGERLLLLSVETEQLEPGHLGRVLDLGALPLELLHRARGDRDVTGEADGSVSVSELLLAAGDRLRLTPAPGRLHEAHAPSGGLVDAVAVGLGRGQARESWTRPGVERDAEGDGEHSWAKRAHHAHVRRGQALGERFEFAEQDGTSARIHSLLPARALD